MIKLGGKRGEVSMSGPALVYPGSTNNYLITDWDAFSEYSAQTEFGTAEITGDTIKLVLPGEVGSATCSFSVSRDGRTKTVTLAVGSQSIRKPSIIAPANGTQGVSLTPTIYFSDFITSPAGVDTQTGTTLEIATDELFTSIAYTVTVSARASLSIPPGTLSLGIVYHAHFKQAGARLPESSWSDTISFKTTTMAAGAVIDGDVSIGQIGGFWLLVAPATKRATKRWGLYGTDTTLPNITSAGAPDPNSGAYNTQVLTSAAYASVNDAQGSVGSPAAEFCKAGGYELPNKEELALIRANMAMIDAADTSGGASKLSVIATSYIWSSTEYSSSYAWVQRFSDGDQTYLNKYSEYWVVPVRRFPI